ncbi:hypothetical protein [uncultured Methylobacterium sp.]|uniref:hypothetical protein n=1 Tax=uncultured Methylobacterium sp. TaxID=157278 RepID=UPI00260C361F|nr:hypothetical protein [uncultured Methylobacterium sp.]
MIDPKLKLVAGDVVTVPLIVQTTCIPGEDSISLAREANTYGSTVWVSRQDATLTTTVLRPGDEVTMDGPQGPGIVRHLIGDQAWVRWPERDSIVQVDWLTRTRTAVEVEAEADATATLMAAE